MTRKPCTILNSRRAGSLWLWENKKEMRDEKESQIFLQKNVNLQKNNIQLQSQLKYISEPAERVCDDLSIYTNTYTILEWSVWEYKWRV